MNKQILLCILLILILLIRVQSLGGFEKPTDPEFENITIYFEPIQQFLSNQADSLLSEPQAGLLMGMVLGVKSSLPSDFKKALRRTSTIHMVVVSGQNLTLLSGFVLSFASLFGRRKTVFISLGLILFYSILTGLQVPVIRAAIMVFLASLAQLFNREDKSSFILLFTACLMLIYNPNWLLSISFQLSFLATFGVVVVAPEILKQLNLLPNLIKQDLAVSLAAQALTWPIIAANFHQASIIGLFANSLVLWTVPIIMITGLAALCLSVLNLFLGQLFALIPGVFLTYFVYIVEFLNTLPFASVYVGKISTLVWVGYYILLLGIFLYIKNTNQQIKES